MKHKVHMLSGEVVDGQATMLCKQRARTLLPLLSSSDWSGVTCSRCLLHQPSPVRTNWFRRQLEAFFGWWR